MSVRSFSLASLLAVAAPALAADPTQAVPSEAPAQAARIEGQWSFSVVDGLLVAELTIVNAGTAAVDVVVGRGHSPGPYARAVLGDTALDLAPTNDQMTDMVSRMGPLPRYAPVAAGEKVLVGTYRWRLPEGYQGQVVRVEAEVATGSTTAVVRTAYTPAGGA